MQKEDETGKSDEDSTGTITPRALGQQQLPRLSTSASSLSTPSPDGDYFSLSQEDHHRGPYQALAVYQRQESSSRNPVLALIPELPQMRSRFAERPARGDPLIRNCFPIASNPRVTAQIILQPQNTQAIQGLRLGIVNTAAPAHRNKQDSRVLPPPHPPFLGPTNRTRQPHYVPGTQFSSLSNMLSAEPTAPDPSASSQTGYPGIPTLANPNSTKTHQKQISPHSFISPTHTLHPVGLFTTQASNTQIYCHNHPQPAQAPGAELREKINLWSLKRARLLGKPQYWVWRMRQQWEADMDRLAAASVRCEEDRLGVLRSGSVAEMTHGEGGGTTQDDLKNRD